jgi:O-antigen/teichoic acid export membrane protein
VSAERVFLAHFASVRAVAFYSVAFTLIGLLTAMPGALCQALLPAFSRLQANTDNHSMQRLYTRSLYANLLWIAPTTVILLAGARPFFTLWAGPEYGRESTLPFYILLGGLAFNAMAAVPAGVLMAIDRTDLIARFHVAELVPYLLFAAVLTASYGPAGAAGAWSLRAVLDAVLLFRGVRAASGCRFQPLPTNRRAYAGAIAALFLPPLLTSQAALPAEARSIIIVVSVAVYVGLLWTEVLTNEERAWIAGVFSSQYSRMGETQFRG